MNPLLTRRYAPEELQGLSKAEFKEMQDLNLSRVQYDMHRLRVAHGDLCCSLIHLHRGAAFFEQHTPALALQLRNLGTKLSELIPSYEEFSAATSLPKGAR